MPTTSAGRVSVIDLIDERDQALHLWREVTGHPMLAAHARCAIAFLEQGTRPEPADLAWTSVDRYGPADARYALLGPLDGDLDQQVRASGHPQAARLLHAPPGVGP